MAILKHTVYDTDTHFSIDPITRALKNETCPKSAIIQNDHNSERFTFELPRIIEGHDMLQCNVVQVHYLNIDAQTKEQSSGVYTVDDLTVSPDSEDVVICSWLISQNATKHMGDLRFLLRFSCVEDDVILYAWNTGIHTNISVSGGIYNGDAFDTEYVDIIERWKATVVEDFLAGAAHALDEWKEGETENIRAVMTDYCAEWNDLLDVERARISAHIAASGDDGQITHELESTEDYEGTIQCNGVMALLTFTLKKNTEVLSEGEVLEFDAIPKGFAPLTKTEIYVKPEGSIDTFTIYVLPPRTQDGNGIVQIENTYKTHHLIPSGTYTGRYYTNEPALAELYDTRVGHDGTVYDTAGDAIRQQTRIAADHADRAEEAAERAENAGGGGGTGAPGKSPYIGENGNWYEYDGTKYVDTGVKASGLPNVEIINSSGYEGDIPAYTELRFTEPVTYLLLGFKRNAENNNNDMWALTFTAGEGISIALPSNIEWAVAEPVFTAGYTYYLSFIPLVDEGADEHGIFKGKILGIWVAKELS